MDSKKSMIVCTCALPLHDTAGFVKRLVPQAAGYPEADFVLIPSNKVTAAVAEMLQDTPVRLGTGVMGIEDGMEQHTIRGLETFFEENEAVIMVGHWEQLCLFQVTHEKINQIIRFAQAKRRCIILCVGENHHNKAHGEVRETLFLQLVNELARIDVSRFHQLVIAYTPFWAIDGSKVLQKTVQQRGLSMIRSILFELFGGRAAVIQVIGSELVLTEDVKSLITDCQSDGILAAASSSWLDAKIEC